MSEDNAIIDLTDLVDTKDDYIERSKDILVTLNELSEDKNQYALVNKLLGFAKKREAVVWPEV